MESGNEAKHVMESGNEAKHVMESGNETKHVIQWVHNTAGCEWKRRLTARKSFLWPTFRMPTTAPLPLDRE